MLRQSLLSLGLPILTAAHFTVSYPPSRGFSEDGISSFPCGGFNTPTAERTEFPLTGGPIQMDNTHTSSNLQVLLALGNNPGDAFNTVVVPTFMEQGPNEFCFGNVSVSGIEGLNITAGTNGTFQVIAGGDEGGLYACVDVTFVNDPLSQDGYAQNCVNATGVSVEYMADMGNANGTEHEEGGHDHDESSSGAMPSATSEGLAAQMTMMAGWAVGGMALAGGLAAL
ncbi:hypothetical protein K402DRAFT_391920 [Aulographum hederae CBS 113979]|uniref:Copper acquisition factor BIM1-like domain-containing protein n=1 Tax=Aulographum hederae CBS 113979 TaxID=1176131 RepID=A0A6G1H5B4_9PEZI|nr:hypothetical protein K402DRAFT_391920 [Aulographum hederae CBS 113979]